MKRISLLLSSLLIITANIPLHAQVLNVQEVIQEQTQWCWAGVSSCTLDYFGTPTAQCDIAEYTRTVATWHDFGPVNCCSYPNLGCNYWNYNWGYPGSIQDILIHFASIQNNGVSSYLSKTTITTEIVNNRPFIIRWGWTSGGGHFLVGHGLTNSNDLYYMNPWYGEGLKIADYSWVVSSSDHSWTHTNQLVTSSPRPYPATSITGSQTLVKGQQHVPYTTPAITNATSYIWEIVPADAGTIASSSANAELDLNPEFLGVLTLTVKGHNDIGNGSVSSPLDVTVSPGAGLPDQRPADVLIIYPNPSSGKISLQLPKNINEPEIDISTISGINILCQPLPPSRSLDLSGLQKGMYLLKVKSGNYSRNAKLILQ